MDKQPSFKQQLGHRIKALREAEGLSQEALAKELDIHRVALTQIENAQRDVSAEELAALSKAFGISTDVILDLKKEIEVVLQIQNKPKKTEPSDMRISVPQEKVDKFKEVLLYILNQVGSRPNVGETVIYKLLYFIDFDFYEKYEDQLIGATYIKNKFGPTPVEFAKIVRKMTDSGEMCQIKTSRSGFEQRKYLPNRQPDLSKLGAHEIKLIDEVLERLSHMGARQISDYSHGDIPWITTEEQKPIEYEAVFYRTPQYSVRDYGESEGNI
jgi:transcriptional regulator with XRE-family HTH domain